MNIKNMKTRNPRIPKESARASLLLLALLLLNFLMVAGLAKALAACGEFMQSVDNWTPDSCTASCTSCCWHVKYTPTCTFCTRSLFESQACYADESYEAAIQSYISGDCYGGQCVGGYPDGDPGPTTCFYCSEGTCGS